MAEFQHLNKNIICVSLKDQRPTTGPEACPPPGARHSQAAVCFAPIPPTPQQVDEDFQVTKVSLNTALLAHTDLPANPQLDSDVKLLRQWAAVPRESSPGRPRAPRAKASSRSDVDFTKPQLPARRRLCFCPIQAKTKFLQTPAYL